MMSCFPLKKVARGRLLLGAPPSFNLKNATCDRCDTRLYCVTTSAYGPAVAVVAVNCAAVADVELRLLICATAGDVYWCCGACYFSDVCSVSTPAGEDQRRGGFG